MNAKDKYFFTLLKQAVAQLFLQQNNASDTIEDWKGEDITAFQEDLLNKVKATVSEKWFYTYIKNDAEKLPRIDMLNILSQYVGYANWNAFTASHSKNGSGVTTKKASKKWYWFLLLLPVVAVVLYATTAENEFEFCFTDEYKNEAITTIPLDIKILQEHESPLHFKTDSSGCFTYSTKNDRIKFVVQSPYYKTDTIIRHINSNHNTTVELQTDDYALMLDYYTNGNIEDWKKRKQSLHNLIADDAEIYQLFEQNIGVELYTKEEFIRTLIIPTNSLKRIRILDKSYKDGKIVKLKFMVR